MKKIFFLFSALAMFACSAPTGTLENVTINYSKESVNIKMSYPYAVGYPQGEQINSSMDTLMRTYLTWDQEVNYTSTYQELIDKIDTTFSSFERETMRFELEMTWYGYENKKILSILSTTFIFSGGAHPNTFLGAHNFCQTTGKIINVIDMIEDKEAFRKTLIDKFISVRDLPTNPTMEQTGLFMEIGDMPIAQTILFTDRGLEVIYNQYEIAPYVMGQIILEIPYEQVKFKGEVDVNDFKMVKADEVK